MSKRSYFFSLLVLGCAQFKSGGNMGAVQVSLGEPELKESNVPIGGEVRVKVPVSFSKNLLGGDADFQGEIEFPDGSKDTVRLKSGSGNVQELSFRPHRPKEVGAHRAIIRIKNTKTGAEQTAEVQYEVSPPPASLEFFLEGNKNNLFPKEEVKLSLRVSQRNMTQQYERRFVFSSEEEAIEVLCNGLPCLNQERTLDAHTRLILRCKRPFETGVVKVRVFGEAMLPIEKEVRLTCNYPDTELNLSLGKASLFPGEETPLKIELRQPNVRGSYERQVSVRSSSDAIEVFPVGNGVYTEGDYISLSSNPRWQVRAVREVEDATITVQIEGAAVPPLEETIQVSCTFPDLKKEAVQDGERGTLELTCVAAESLGLAWLKRHHDFADVNFIAWENWEGGSLEFKGRPFDALRSQLVLGKTSLRVLGKPAQTGNPRLVLTLGFGEHGERWEIPLDQLKSAYQAKLQVDLARRAAAQREQATKASEIQVIEEKTEAATRVGNLKRLSEKVKLTESLEREIAQLVAEIPYVPEDSRADLQERINELEQLIPKGSGRQLKDQEAQLRVSTRRAFDARLESWQNGNADPSPADLKEVAELLDDVGLLAPGIQDHAQLRLAAEKAQESMEYSQEANPLPSAMYFIQQKDKKGLEDFLAKHRFDLNEEDWRRGGKTLLSEAIASGSEDLANHLLSKRSIRGNVGHQGAGHMPTQEAARQKKPDFLDKLVRKGADLREKDREGATCLHAAAEVADNGSVINKILAAIGADAACADSAGRTALHVAAERGHADTIRLLMANAHIQRVKDAPTHEGKTALHLVIELEGAPANAACEALQGASLFTRDRAGLTPSGIAFRKGLENPCGVVTQTLERIRDDLGSPDRLKAAVRLLLGSDTSVRDAAIVTCWNSLSAGVRADGLSEAGRKDYAKALCLLAGLADRQVDPNVSIPVTQYRSTFQEPLAHYAAKRVRELGMEALAGLFSHPRLDANKQYEGKTALDIASNAAVLQLLLDREDLTGETLLGAMHRAVQLKSLPAFKKVLAHPNFDGKLASRRSTLGKTGAIHIAVCTEDNAFLKALLEQEGVDLNLASGSGCSVLDYLAKSLHFPPSETALGKLEALMEDARFDVNQRLSDGKNFADHLIKVLRNYEPDFAKSAQNTPQLEAVTEAVEPFFRLLSKKGAHRPRGLTEICVFGTDFALRFAAMCWEDIDVNQKMDLAMNTAFGGTDPNLYWIQRMCMQPSGYEDWVTSLQYAFEAFLRHPKANLEAWEEESHRTLPPAVVIAASWGQTDVLEMLLAAGAKASPNPQGMYVARSLSNLLCDWKDSKSYGGKLYIPEKSCRILKAHGASSEAGIWAKTHWALRDANK